MATGKTPPAPSATTSASGGNVHQLHKAAPVIEPEDGWSKSTPEGWHLVAQSGNGGCRLVQLVTVFRGAVERSDAPPVVAMKQTLAKVAEIPPSALFLLDEEGEWPTVFAEGQALPCFCDDVDRFLDRLGCTGSMPSPPRKPYGHGTPGLLALMEAAWVTDAKGVIPKEKPSSDPHGWNSFIEWAAPSGSNNYLCRLAVPFAVAHALWGWGRPVGRAVVAGEDAGSEIDAPLWLASKGLNVAWLKGERDRFEKAHPKRGMGKLLESLEQKGVAVPGADKGREVRRVLAQQEEPSGKAKKAMPFDGLGSRKTAGNR